MVKYIHTFKVSSGKKRKEIVKVYTDKDKAVNQLILLGGKLEMVEVLMVKEG